MPLIVALLVLALAALPGWASSEGGRPRIDSVEAAEGVEDERSLIQAADYWRDQGDDALARALYLLAIERAELHKYLTIRPALKEALILERLGKTEQATELFRAERLHDVQTVLQVLRIASVHPQREELVQEAIADVRDRVERARRGEQVPIFTTSKGETRNLEIIPDDQVLPRLLRDDGQLRYCYIDTLDLSTVKAEQLPASIVLSRCIVGRVLVPDRDVHTLVLRSIVLGDVDIGKTWEGQVNRSRTIPASRVAEIAFRDGVFLGRVNLQGVHVSGRNALFAMAVFEGEADFRDTTFEGTADFRFSVFGKGANFKGSHMTDAVYFGNTRYLQPVTFRGMYSEQDVFFNSTQFEASASFDRCEWVRGATFENSVFRGPVSFNNSQLGGRLNISRAVVHDTLVVKEVSLAGMDLIGTRLTGDASFIDVNFLGKVRFSLDDITRAHHLDDPTGLLSLYRDYQGDKDAETPLTTRSSYGVESVDDLIAQVDGNISFANSIFHGFTIFERVRFGRPGVDTTAEFYNTQFMGESHFERAVFYSRADFSTMFANELSFLEASFHSNLILDDAHVAGRLVLTDATFEKDADISIYASEMASVQINRDQVVENDDWSWLWQAGEEHRLFYKRCLDGKAVKDDPRLRRLQMSGSLSDEELRTICAARLMDEYVALKQSFGDRAMTGDEDWAYWWIKHTQAEARLRQGGAVGFAYWVLARLLFEIGFGWGVNLGNLAFTSLFVCGLFALLYRILCPDSILSYDGDDVPVREVPMIGLFFVSLQSFGAFNTGWDIGYDNGRLRYLNTIQTFIGLIILTFFVGAYTRMILA